MALRPRRPHIPKRDLTRRATATHQRDTVSRRGMRMASTGVTDKHLEPLKRIVCSSDIHVSVCCAVLMMNYDALGGLIT